MNYGGELRHKTGGGLIAVLLRERGISANVGDEERPDLLGRPLQRRSFVGIADRRPPPVIGEIHRPPHSGVSPPGTQSRQPVASRRLSFTRSTLHPGA
jgi:hypothetical protein